MSLNGGKFTFFSVIRDPDIDLVVYDIDFGLGFGFGLGFSSGPWWTQEHSLGDGEFKWRRR